MINPVTTNETLLGQVLRYPLRLLPKGTIVPVLSGPARGARWLVGAGTHGCWLGTYEADKMRIFATLVKARHVVYDIGANAGIYTVLASTLVGSEGKVFAFEPLPRNVEYLRRHVRINQRENVVVMSCAVSDEATRARFDATVGPSQGRLSEAGDIDVETVTLDGLLTAGQILPADVIKIDVEGAEDRVLAGAETIITERRPIILLATHGSAVHHGCCMWLRERGYRLRSVSNVRVDETDELLALRA